MILSYEEMKADLHGSVEKMAVFLGHSLDKETVESITKQCTFNAMQKNKAANRSWLDKFRKTETPFMRKGIVGDWRNYFTEEQSKKMDMLVVEKMTGTGLEYDYGQ